MEFLGNFLKSPDTDSYYYTAHIKVQKFQAADKLLLLINGVRSSKVQVMRRFIGFILGKLGLGSCSSTLKQQHQRQSQYVGVFFDSFILPEGLPLQQYVPNTLPLLNFSRDAMQCAFTAELVIGREIVSKYFDMMLPKDTLDCHFFGQFFVLNFLMRKAE